MHKNDFTEFEVGTVFNGAILSQLPVKKYESLTVSYPSRLEAMALDPARIADNNNLIYEAGQIDFSVALFKHITVKTIQDGSITISDRSPRKALIMHAALLMQNALGLEEGFFIDVKDDIDLRHCGLGSSSSLIAGTAAAINELYNCPIAPLDLVRYCAQNHGEEIDGSNTKLVPVQCIGGSGVCGHFEGGLIILAGQATPIFTTKLPENLKVVIGIPSDFTHPDSQELMEAEVNNMNGFKNAGNKYGAEIAYRVVHEVMPGLVTGDLKPAKELIFDYRWNMDSIKNCAFVYPRMLDVAESLRSLKDDADVKILSLSSVGPGFFAITSNPNKVADIFAGLGMTTHLTTIHNGKYMVTNNETIS